MAKRTPEPTEGLQPQTLGSENPQTGVVANNEDSEPKAAAKKAAVGIDLAVLVQQQAAQLQLMQQQMETMSKVISEQADLIDYVADKRRMEAYERKHQDPNAKVFKIAKYRGKVVIGWERMVENTVTLLEKGKWMEVLKTTLVYEDGTKETVEYKDWQLNAERFEAVLEEERKDKEGNVTYLLKDSEGRPYEIGQKFVNV